MAISSDFIRQPVNYLAAALVLLLVQPDFHTARPVFGAPLTPGNILSSRLNTGLLREFTPGGVLVQSFPFPDTDGDEFEDLRDVIVDGDGKVHGFEGTFDPHLTTLTPSLGTFSSQTFAEWSTVNNVSYGGIGHTGNYVFVTDMDTFGASSMGIVRFDFSGGATVRFGDDEEYQDLTIGGDGLVYGLRGDSESIDVFHPNSLSSIRTITLQGNLSFADVRGIAVDTVGTVYAAAWDGVIYAASSVGVELDSIASGANDLTDIDLDNSGNLLIGGRFGEIISTDVNLDSVTSFTPFAETVHVAFVSPLVPVPEPSGVALSAMLLVALGGRRRMNSGRGEGTADS